MIAGNIKINDIPKLKNIEYFIDIKWIFRKQEMEKRFTKNKLFFK